MTRLRVEDLEVSTFATTVYPSEPIIGTDDPNQVIWTGCLSDCTQCGTGGGSGGMDCFAQQDTVFV